LCAPDAACYVNNGAQLINKFAMVDYGVDTQKATFAFGAAGATPTNTLDTSGAKFASNFETATSQSDILSVTVTDALSNTITRFASTAPGTTVSTATNAAVQPFGIDVTAPPS